MRSDRDRDHARAEKTVGLILGFLTAIIGWLPPFLAAWCGRWAGDLGFVVFARRRRIAFDNLRRAFPALSPRRRRQICRRSFQHLGLMGVELCALLARPLDWSLDGVTIEGIEYLKDSMEKYGRVLVLAAHLGNWELLPAAHRLTGYRLSVVVRPLDSRWLDAFVTRLRRKTGIDLIDKRQALRPVLKALEQGGLVGILLDQNAARREGAFVPFFDYPACTSRSIAVLALRTHTPVVPIFIRRETLRKHRVSVRPALEPPQDGNVEEGVAAFTARCTEVIETAIRETPEQWLWIHNRWRTRPRHEGNECGKTSSDRD